MAERRCWQVARREDTRVARRLDRTQEVDGVDRLDEGAVLDDFFHFLQARGVLALLEAVHGTAIQRQMVPYVQDVLLYGLKTLFGIERLNALPSLLCSDEALLPLVGFNAPHVRQGRCQRGATKRQGEGSPGPLRSETWANNIVKLHVRDLESVFTGAIRALAQAGIFGKQVTGMADGTDRETTARSRGCGQVTRTVRLEDQQGRVHAIEVTVYGWNVLLLIEAITKIPLAVKVTKMHAHEALWPRALVTPARMNLAGVARLPKVIFDKGFVDGTTLWWLDQHEVTVVVPAKAKMAVTADARAQAAAGEESTVGRRAHTVRHGPGQTARPERLETEVVGLTGLTTDDQDGTPEQERHANRRDFQPNPIHAVVVRKWNGKDSGPGGNPVFLTKAPAETPLQVFADDDDRSLIEHCWIKACQQQWEGGHPPHKTERAVQVPVVFTRLLFALATADRLPCEREATGGEFVGWPRWRRQLLEQTRAQGMVFAQGVYGILPLAEDSLLVGVKRKNPPPSIGTRQGIVAKFGLMTQP
jgi:hypothetical protein